MGIKNRIIKNTLLNVVFTILASLVSFVLLGYMVRKLGAEEYGLIGFCSIFSLAGYLHFLDFGLQTAIIKYTAEFDRVGDTEKVCQLINSSLFLFLPLSLLVTLCGFILLYPLSHLWLNIPLLHQQSFQISLGLIFISYLFEFPNMVFSGVLEGLQRYDILKGMHFIYTIFFAMVASILLYFGYGYVSIVTAMTALSFLRFVIYVVYTFRLLPYLKIRSSYFSKDMLRQIKTMTKYVFMGNISGFIHGRSDKILIAIFLNPVFMASYDIISRLPQLLKTLMGFGYSAIMPAASEIQSLNDTSMLKKLLFKGWRFNLFFYVPIITAAIVLSKPFLVVWVGNEYASLSIFLQFLIGQHILLIMVSFANAMLYGMNVELRTLTRITLFGTLIKFVVTLLLIVNFKLWGVVVGLMLSMLIPLPLGIKVILKEFKLSFSEFFREIWRVASVIFVPFTLYYFFSRVVSPFALWSLLLHGTIWCLVYWGVLYFFVMDDDNKKLIHELAAKILPKRKIINQM